MVGALVSVQGRTRFGCVLAGQDHQDFDRFAPATDLQGPTLEVGAIESRRRDSIDRHEQLAGRGLTRESRRRVDDVTGRGQGRLRSVASWWHAVIGAAHA